MNDTTAQSFDAVAEPTIWGIHMGLQHGSKPIDEGYVSIGWQLLGDLSKLPANRDDLKERIQKAYPETKTGAVPVHAGILYRFAHEMRNGDIVVYPSSSVSQALFEQTRTSTASGALLRDR